jgi:hypothetical protein
MILLAAMPAGAVPKTVSKITGSRTMAERLALQDQIADDAHRRDTAQNNRPEQWASAGISEDDTRQGEG